jgi:uncharacterized protein YecE (DUF72 family)
MSLYVGTSGYSYKEWKGSFYPEKIPAKDMLSYYASRLQAVELNNTFYRLPQQSMIESWKSQVPDNFRFTMKASQLITHFKKLKDAASETRLMLKRFAAFEDRMGAVLYRLPPDMKKDSKRLEAFLKHLPANPPAAFQLEDPTWLDKDVFALLRSQNRAFSVTDTDEIPLSHIERTADWGYVRLRRVNYSESELKEWIGRIQAQDWTNTFVFFKHEDEGTGPKLAAQFLQLANAV